MSAAAPTLEWITARDGSRTARDRATGALLADCSVPRRAAEMMLRKLSVKGRVACLLLPTHAQQIAVCLEKTDPTIGVIVITESESALTTLRACCDFDLHASRLFFAWDATSLRAVFDAHPGLAVPQQFVRLPDADKAGCDAAIIWTQEVFSEVTTAQSRRVELARTRPTPTAGRALAIVSRTFRLWDDAGDRLARSVNAELLDTDDPRLCASAEVAERASYASMILTANVGRADQVVAANARTPWITWITGSRVPAYVPTSPRDGLVLTVDALLPFAHAAGWPADRVRIGRDPAVACRGGETLAIVMDLPSLAPPAEIVEYSSWRVVWEAVARDLVDHPHRLAGDVEGYLERSRRHFGVPAADFPRSTFVTHLIGPAYAIGIARWLVRERVPVAIHGRGWDEIDGIDSHARGPVESREALDQILTQTSGLVETHLSAWHASRYSGAPMLTTLGRTPQRILQDARAMMKATPVPASAAQTLVDAIESLCR